MSRNLLGVHWIRTHPDGADLAHIEAMQYPSAKLFEWHWSDANACRDFLTVFPRDGYILARDHPLSEQKEDMWRDPKGTGIRHANEWAGKVGGGRYHLPTDRSFFLGINEPDATSGDRDAIDRYAEAFLRRLQEHGLRGGAFNFSTGHPRTVDGTPNTPADYSVFERSHRAIVEGNHIAVCHIYGTAAQPCVPGHYDRLRACEWKDVEWVVGEMGADEHVIGGGPHDGYLESMKDHPPRYCAWLDALIMGIDDSRIHSYQVFTYDFSHPWGSFDTRPIRAALESYPWQHPKRTSTSLPQVGNQPTPPAPTPGGVDENTNSPTPPPAPTLTGAIDPQVLEAILQVESNGRTHGPDGRPLIRFEAHVFRDRAKDKGRVDQFFKFNPQKPWTEQMYRITVDHPWKPIHTGSQEDENNAYSLGQMLDTKAADESISMGAGQIMGFNHARIGYPSARAMYKAFRSAPVQTIGFLNYFLSDSALIDAVRRKDWREIARRYNGAGAVDTYAPLLEQAYQKVIG